MGTQFFWVFDIAIVAILAAFVFKGIRQGFVAAIAGAVSLVLAFIVTLPLSAVISDAIYENIIKDAVAEEVNKQIGSVVDTKLLNDIKKVDMSKIRINGRELSSIDIKPDNLGKVSIDLSNIDVSKTGIEKADLSVLGINKDTVDYSSLNLGMLVMTSGDIDTYGVETIILASVLSNNISNSTAFGSIVSAVEKMADSVPMLSGIADSITSGEKSVIRDVMLSIVSTETDDFARTITDDMVKPVLLVPIRALIFLILFVIIAIILNIAARLLKIVNKIPLVGNVNKTLGAVAGAAEAVIVIFLVCIFINVAVTLSGNELIFLNTMTIDETLIFQKIYYFEFLDFLA